MSDKSESTAKTALRLHIRWMIRRDMPEVLRIEQASHDFPWCEEDFLRALRTRNCIGMVAAQGEKVVGFMVYELHRTKLYILNFAVHPDYRRRGVGAQMAEKLVSKLSSHRRTRLVIDVRETNLNAQLFFRSVGFCAISVARKFFADSGEDAYVMEYRLADSEAVTEFQKKTTAAFQPTNRLTQYLREAE